MPVLSRARLSCPARPERYRQPDCAVCGIGYQLVLSYARDSEEITPTNCSNYSAMDLSLTSATVSKYSPALQRYADPAYRRSHPFHDGAHGQRQQLGKNDLSGSRSHRQTVGAAYPVADDDPHGTAGTTRMATAICSVDPKPSSAPDANATPQRERRTGGNRHQDHTDLFRQGGSEADSCGKADRQHEDQHADGPGPIGTASGDAG